MFQACSTLFKSLTPHFVTEFFYRQIWLLFHKDSRKCKTSYTTTFPTKLSHLGSYPSSFPITVNRTPFSNGRLVLSVSSESHILSSFWIFTPYLTFLLFLQLLFNLYCVLPISIHTCSNLFHLTQTKHTHTHTYTFLVRIEVSHMHLKLGT